MNLESFAKSKIENFCSFLKTKFGKSQKVIDDIETYKNLPVIDFLIYIRENIANENVEKYVDRKFSEYLPNEKLDNETHKKLIAYLEMFIDLAKS